MRSRLHLSGSVAAVAALFVCCVTFSRSAFAQSAAGSEATQPTVVLTVRNYPKYPAEARESQISGDVGLRLQIRPDGTIQGVDVINGHPLLAQAALDGLKSVQFECRSCTEPVTLYSIVYQFRIQDCTETGGNTDPVPETSQPSADRLHGYVTITTLKCPIIDYFPTKVRAARCLYLWKCKAR